MPRGHGSYLARATVGLPQRKLREKTFLEIENREEQRWSYLVVTRMVGQLVINLRTRYTGIFVARRHV